MMTATRTSSPTWQAEITWDQHRIPIEEGPPEGEPDGEPKVTILKVWICFVDASRPTGERIRFRVNHRVGRSLTVTDPRDRLAGTTNTTGIWGTRPPPRASRSRPMTLPSFRPELTRLIGAEQAEAIIRSIREMFPAHGPRFGGRPRDPDTSPTRHRVNVPAGSREDSALGAGLMTPPE
jgi:hypothetical protein